MGLTERAGAAFTLGHAAPEQLTGGTLSRTVRIACAWPASQLGCCAAGLLSAASSRPRRSAGSGGSDGYGYGTGSGNGTGNGYGTGTGIAANMAGLSMALGAFISGLMLAETEYRRAIEAKLASTQGTMRGQDRHARRAAARASPFRPRQPAAAGIRQRGPQPQLEQWHRFLAVHVCGRSRTHHQLHRWREHQQQ